MRLDLYDINCQLLSTIHKYTTVGWVEADLLAPHFLSNGDVLTLLPRSDFTQIVRINTSSVIQITKGHEVRSIVAVYNSESVFYTTADYSYETHLYVVSLSDTSDVMCISCSLSKKLIGTELEKRECKVASAVFSTDCKSLTTICIFCLSIGVIHSSLLRSDLSGTRHALLSPTQLLSLPHPCVTG